MKSYWTIPKIWSGECICLGGGTSLSDFNFDLLRDHNVIGANDAYLLGEKLVDFVFFGDKSWYNVHETKLQSYRSIVVTNHTDIIPNGQVKVCKKTKQQLTESDYSLAWYSNSGLVQVELAMKMGATKIYMLGYDMKLNAEGNRANYYENIKKKPSASSYDRFINSFKKFESQRKHTIYKDVKIINANMDSELQIYPKIPREEVFK